MMMMTMIFLAVDLTPAKVTSRNSTTQQQHSETEQRSKQESIQAQDKDKVRRHHINHNHRNVSRTRSGGNLPPHLHPDLAQRRHSDDVRYSQAREHGGRNSGDEDASSSANCGRTDNNVRPEQKSISPSASNSRCRQPLQISFSDLDAASGDENKRWMTTDGTRRKSMSSASRSLLMTLMQRTMPTTMQSRASQIPVRMDRPHPTTINHVDNIRRRYSANAIIDSHTTAAMLDLSRDLKDKNSLRSCDGNQVESSQSKVAWTTSSNGHSLTEARRRVLARLAECQSPGQDSEVIGVRAPPRKLDPILSTTFVYDNDDDDDE